MKVKNWSYLENYAEIGDEIQRAVTAVFRSGRLILGDRVRAFELDFAAWCQARHGIGVNSGTDAIMLGLRALGVGPGDEVVTVANTAVPTVSAIRATGAVPVFVDIDETTYVMDVSQVADVVTSRTKAIVPVHLYGHAVNMGPLLEVAQARGLGIVEDCAQSHGTRYSDRMTGTIGDVGAFSFYPTKILGAYGDGGLCLTSNDALANKLRKLRMYGMAGEYYSHVEGYNSRLDEVQAAILNVKLKYLNAAIAKRQAIARLYDDQLKGVLETPAVKAYSNHTYYLYVVRHPDRDRLVKALRASGIEINVHFPYPIHLMEAYRFLGYSEGHLPATERSAREVLSLPMYPELPPEAVETTVTTIKRLLS